MERLHNPPRETTTTESEKSVIARRPVGISSRKIYSYCLREVLSMGCVDLDASKIGTEVIVQWGDHGGRIKDHGGRIKNVLLAADRKNAVRRGRFTPRFDASSTAIRLFLSRRQR